MFSKTGFMKKSCDWPGKDPMMIEYHDTEWGVPLHDDRKLFEFLILEGFQAGLSWSTVLKKREAFREAFSGFDPEKVSRFTDTDVERLMQNAGIIRNRLKIRAAINNAQQFLKVQKEFGSFDRYIWGFVDHKPVVNCFERLSDLPAKTPLSDKISKDMVSRGFKFVGSTIVYAHMQATGMVNDHLVHCFRYSQINAV
jgi:DNA-3-methyladenine glycosylase I